MPSTKIVPGFDLFLLHMQAANSLLRRSHPDQEGIKGPLTGKHYELLCRKQQLQLKFLFIALFLIFYVFLSGQNKVYQIPIQNIAKV